ncbi:MAG: cytochrome c [Cellvibrionaceae bacterium]
MFIKNCLVKIIAFQNCARSCLLFSVITMVACSDQGNENIQEKELVSRLDANIVAVAGASQAQLPISLNELMVALVNQAADPIWVAAWKNPQTDKEWRNLEYLSYQLEVAGALLKIPGTGPLDIAWTSDERWGELSDRLAAAGSRALVAIKTRDQEAINLAGDDIVDICESCHKLFKPSIPTGKVYGELSPTD